MIIDDDQFSRDETRNQEGWKDGRMEGWKNGRMEEWKDGRKDEGVTESVNKKNLEDPVRICVAFTYLHMFEFCKTIL